MLFSTPVVAGDWEDALAAYKAGDYQKTFRLLEPLAEQGGARAQDNLGGMYDHGGKGVAEKDAKTVHWYRKAAERINKKVSPQLFKRNSHKAIQTAKRR